MTFYMENPKSSTKKLPELINEFSKVPGYKINTERSIAFLYTNNELLENGTKNPIYNCIKNKITRLDLIKDVKDLYLENCKILKEEIEEDINKEAYTMFRDRKN